MLPRAPSNGGSTPTCYTVHRHSQADGGPRSLLRRRVIDGPAEQGLDRANRTYAGLAGHLFKTQAILVRKSAM